VPSSEGGEERRLNIKKGVIETGTRPQKIFKKKCMSRFAVGEQLKVSYKKSEKEKNFIEDSKHYNAKKKKTEQAQKSASARSTQKKEGGSNNSLDTRRSSRKSVRLSCRKKVRTGRNRAVQKDSKHKKESREKAFQQKGGLGFPKLRIIMERKRLLVSGEKVQGGGWNKKRQKSNLAGLFERRILLT